VFGEVHMVEGYIKEEQMAEGHLIDRQMKMGKWHLYVDEGRVSIVLCTGGLHVQYSYLLLQVSRLNCYIIQTHKSTEIAYFARYWHIIRNISAQFCSFSLE
jgi:hypothetical protein